MQSYLTINGECEQKIEINRSLFICNIKGIDTYEEGIIFEKEIAKKYSNATHNCYALLLKNGSQKFFDDGEPSGTAGQPILSAIKNKNLYNTVAVVTRYFGGIKLGTGGLISAYTDCTIKAIENANIVEKYCCLIGELETIYNELPSIENLFRKTHNKIIDTIYKNSVIIKFGIKEKEKEIFEQKLAEITSGKSVIKWVEKKYISFI